MFPTFLLVQDHSNPASMNHRLVEFCYAARAAEAGRLCIFPAWLPREMTENTVDEDRISMVFNIVGAKRASA
jgi:hypothetical protein